MLYRTTPLFLKVFDLQTLEDLPDPAQWDATPEEEATSATACSPPATPARARPPTEAHGAMRAA